MVKRRTKIPVRRFHISPNKWYSFYMTDKSLLPSQKLAMQLEDRLDSHKKWSDCLADFLTSSFGTVWFLTINGVFFLFWIAVNIGLLEGVTPFDPYPFGLLTMLISLEAIFLTVTVLISQNRSTKIDELRQELDFIVTLQAEEEITRMINMLDEIHDHLGLESKDDKELSVMKEKIDIHRLSEVVARHAKHY